MDLAKCHIDRANATTDGCGQGAFDRNPIFPNGLIGILGKPGPLSVDAIGLLAGVDLVPADATLAAEGLVHGCIKDANRGRPDIRADAISLDEGNDRVIGNR